VPGPGRSAGTLVAMTDLERILDDPLGAAADPSPERRRLAISMLAGDPRHLEVVTRALEDPEPRIRAEAAEALGAMGAPAVRVLLARTEVETDETAIEALAAALGEVEDPAAVPWLMEIAAGSHDTLTRETAVASLGAIGDHRALPLLLTLVAEAPPQVRRRTVVALTVFDGDEVEAAVRSAATDRNPMVREAAEMIVGRPVTDWVGVELRRSSVPGEGNLAQ